MRRTAVALLVAVSSSIAAGRVAAQKMPAGGIPAAQERHVRGGIGVLAGTAGLGPALDLSVNTRQRLYRARLTVHDNVVGSWEAYRERRTVSEAAVMLGRGQRFTRNYGSVSGGLAMVTVIYDAENERTTLGIPVEAQLISGGPLRLGATLAGNLNMHRPFAAFILSVQLGGVP